MRRWKITIEYDGRPYYGFQKQKDFPSVQEAIETAIHKFSQQETSITVAGRTDAGVHATGQVAHFDLDYTYDDGRTRAINGFELAKAINAHLSDHPISIVQAEEVDEEFHARFGALNKRYDYHILNRPYRPALDTGRVWWVKPELDIDAMINASRHLIGEHDFTSFRATECQAKSPVRSIDSIQFDTKEIMSGQIIIMRIEGRAFLHHQVRNIIGTLKLVGEGKWSDVDVKAALDARARAAGGPTAPPDGLYLTNIEY